MKTPLKDRPWFKDLVAIAPKVASGIVSFIPGIGPSLSQLINNIDTTVEEKTKAIDFITTQEGELFSMDATDRASARDLEKTIANSEYSSWLEKNITGIIAILYTTAFLITLLVFPPLHIVVAVETMHLLEVFETLILGYYFGSSLGSKLKSAASGQSK